MTDESSQTSLWSAVRRITSHLLGCESSLRPRAGVQYIQHDEFARRVRLLGMFLHTALRAAVDHEYPAALALLRPALEHRVFDRLLFLASRHQQVIDGVTNEVWERWQREPPEFLIEWERLPRDRVRAVWRGPRVVGEKGELLYFLSIYYRWWKKYDPLAVPDHDAENIAVGHPESPTSRSAHARTQREMWRDVLAWKNLKESLILNDLATRIEVTQLDVHYRFLSVYVHPLTEEIANRLYGRNRLGDWTTEDHYAEELVLLYVATLAIDELRDFAEMADKEPRVDLADWEEVRRDLAAVEPQIEHFWPPGRRPYSYDRAIEANQRVFDAMAAQHDAGQSFTLPRAADPDAIPESQVRYYPDPLRRLVQLHGGFSEITTGVSWPSPWPRADARNR